MKKSLLIVLALVSASILPSWASYGLQNKNQANGAALAMGKSLDTASGVQQAIRLANENSIKTTFDHRQAFLPVNPYQSYFDQNPYAKTELKIDLDNFDLEYVLKIR